MARKVLVTVEHCDGTAAVVRIGHELLLTDDLRHGAGTMLDDQTPCVIGLAGDRTLQGGVLPAGAVTALVVDDAGVRRAAAAGGGAWAIVLGQPCQGAISPVCFRSWDGELVAPRLPAAWPRAPVADAHEPCPACDEAAGWDEVRANDASRGASRAGMHPAPFAVCRACGHKATAGTFYASGAIDEEVDQHELVRRSRKIEAELRREALRTLHDLPFCVYAAHGWTRRLGGWGSSNGAPSSVTVEHGARPGESGPALIVRSERQDRAYESERAIARSTLFGELSADAGPWAQRSQAGLAVLLHVRDRARLRTAARAAAGERTLLVDGEPASFQALATGDRWVAVRRDGELVLTVAARDVDPGAVELVALVDPERDL
jgi:hypothetical protein